MTNPAAKKKQLPAFLVLTIIAVIAAIALAVTNQVTKDPIAAHAEGGVQRRAERLQL